VNTGVVALATADIVAALLPLLADLNTEHFEVVSLAVKIIRSLMGRQEIADAFNARGGSELLFRRIHVCVLIGPTTTIRRTR
jgi:hypothetical protein